MSDELKKALEKLDRAVEKIDKGVRLVATDVGELKRRADGHDRSFKKLFEQLAEDRKETDTALRSMAASQASMASGMSQRLEAMLFPPKH